MAGIIERNNVHVRGGSEWRWSSHALVDSNGACPELGQELTKCF
jgi:hypothetical protein